jgi:hypothetical protein
VLFDGESIKWKDAFTRAESGHLVARLVALHGEEDACRETWRVARPDTGTLRRVDVVWTVDGIASACCECRTREQIERDQPCCHMASAVAASCALTIQDAWQDDDGELVTVVEPLAGQGYAVPVQMIEA